MHETPTRDLSRFGVSRQKPFAPVPTKVPNRQPYQPPNHTSLLKRRLEEAKIPYVPQYSSCYMTYARKNQKSPFYVPEPPKGCGYLSTAYKSKYTSLFQPGATNWSMAGSLIQSHLEPLYLSSPIVAGKEVIPNPHSLKSVRTLTNKDEFIQSTLDRVRRANAMKTLCVPKLDFSEQESNQNAKQRREFVKYYSSYGEPCWNPIAGTPVTEANDIPEIVQSSEAKPALTYGSTCCQMSMDSSDNVHIETNVPNGLNIMVSFKDTPKKEIIDSLRTIRNEIETNMKDDLKQTSFLTPRNERTLTILQGEGGNSELKTLSDILGHENWITGDMDVFPNFEQRQVVRNDAAKPQEPELVNVNIRNSEGNETVAIDKTVSRADETATGINEIAKSMGGPNVDQLPGSNKTISTERVKPSRNIEDVLEFVNTTAITGNKPASVTNNTNSAEDLNGDKSEVTIEKTDTRTSVSNANIETTSTHVQKFLRFVEEDIDEPRAENEEIADDSFDEDDIGNLDGKIEVKDKTEPPSPLHETRNQSSHEILILARKSFNTTDDEKEYNENVFPSVKSHTSRARTALSNDDEVSNRFSHTLGNESNKREARKTEKRVSFIKQTRELQSSASADSPDFNHSINSSISRHRKHFTSRDSRNHILNSGDFSLSFDIPNDKSNVTLVEVEISDILLEHNHSSKLHTTLAFPSQMSSCDQLPSSFLSSNAEVSKYLSTRLLDRVTNAKSKYFYKMGDIQQMYNEHVDICKDMSSL